MKYNIYTKYKNDSWEYCDSATTKEDKNYLLNEYKIAFGNDFKFKVKRIKENS